jgi:hypothetical protein
MTITSRPSLTFGKDPMLMWNQVKDAASYKFKVVKKEALEVLWEIEVSKQLSDLLCEDGYCQCYYPKNVPFLEPLVFYSFVAIAETYNGEPLEFQTEYILLEENAQNAFKEFTALVDKEGTKAIRDQWQVTKEAIADFHIPNILNGVSGPNWDRWHSCLTAIFLTEG